LDHAKLRGYSSAAVAVDFGDEPPLSVDGEGAGVDRRRVSVQWFSGTILTGLCGAALMGGAVFAALDGETNFATVPERLETALRGSLTGISERLSAISRKSDKLPTGGGESNASRHVIRISTTNRVGDREVVRVRPFVRVSSNLALSVTELSANIPPFNPQKIMLGDSGATPAPGDETVQAEPNVEVSFVTRDLGPMLVRAKMTAQVPVEEVVARVREMTNFTGSTPVSYAGASGLPIEGKLGYAAEGKVDPYAGFETRIVPENITMLGKTAAHGNGGNGGEKTITLKKGENVTTVLRELGVGAADIKAVTSVLGARGRDNGVKEGQRLRILLSNLGIRVQPLRVIVMGESTTEAVVALSDMGKYVPVDVQSAYPQTAKAAEEEDEDDGTGVRLYQSVYETALRNQIPRPVIEEMIRIYSYDVDFQRKTQPGDAFEVLYTGDDEAAGADAKPDVVFAALTVAGEPKKYYRFTTTDDGLVDYYDDTGKSAKKFLVRKPLADGILRSGFGARHHPILGYTKMHTGVDWAAPMGTPIYAAGGGTVEKAGWESGYGKYIRIRHTNGYQTAYGHMTAFARGMEIGKKVRQGQLIGFVGSTGLSTGAHLHYEIIVNDRYVDPMRIKLPRGRTLEGILLSAFEGERDRLDGMMTQSPSRVAGATR
jgi:murein DD-endopeptidase MepM/ murein hydrolase activator NlpD